MPNPLAARFPVVCADVINSSLRLNLINGALFQAGWLAAVLGGNDWACVALVLMVAVHAFWWVDSVWEWWLISAVVVAGSLLDSFWMHLGVLLGPEAFIPLWLICLWGMFAMTLVHFFSWLHQRLWLACLLGAVSGPASYWAGAQWSDMAIGVPRSMALLCIAMAWGVLMPVLMLLARRVNRVEACA